MGGAALIRSEGAVELRRPTHHNHQPKRRVALNHWGFGKEIGMPAVVVKEVGAQTDIPRSIEVIDGPL